MSILTQKLLINLQCPFSIKPTWMGYIYNHDNIHCTGITLEGFLYQNLYNSEAPPLNSIRYTWPNIENCGIHLLTYSFFSKYLEKTDNM